MEKCNMRAAIQIQMKIDTHINLHGMAYGHGYYCGCGL